MLDDSLRGEIGDEELDHLSSLRPSRIREVQAGRLGWTTVQLVDIESGAGGPIRPVLEHFGIRVVYTAVGQSRHLVNALKGEETTTPFVVLACHGDGGRILLPELAPEYERFQPWHGPAGPDEVRRFLHVPGSVVIATGCDTGDDALAQAFLDVGATAYVAPAGAPFGYASLFAPIFLFYELTEGRSLEQAVARLRAHDAELAMWRLFAPAGVQPAAKPALRVTRDPRHFGRTDRSWRPNDTRQRLKEK